MIPRCLSLTLTCASGPVGSPGGLDLVLRLSGLEGRPASASVATEGSALRDTAVPLEAFRELCRLAGELGLDTRELRVRPVTDTSDSWVQLLLHASTERGERTLGLPLMASSFEGEDAAALRDFLRRVLEAAGIEDADLRRRVTGAA